MRKKMRRRRKRSDLVLSIFLRTVCHLTTSFLGSSKIYIKKFDVFFLENKLMEKKKFSEKNTLFIFFFGGCRRKKKLTFVEKFIHTMRLTFI